MLLIAAVSLLGGIILGMRFRLLVLIPALGIAAAGAVAGTLATGAGPWGIFAAVVTAITALQIGYFSGSLLQHARVNVEVGARRRLRATAH
jgi:hypothetical protein